MFRLIRVPCTCLCNVSDRLICIVVVKRCKKAHTALGACVSVWLRACACLQLVFRRCQYRTMEQPSTLFNVFEFCYLLFEFGWFCVDL